MHKCIFNNKILIRFPQGGGLRAGWPSCTDMKVGVGWEWGWGEGVQTYRVAQPGPVEGTPGYAVMKVGGRGYQTHARLSRMLPQNGCGYVSWLGCPVTMHTITKHKLFGIQPAISPE